MAAKSALKPERHPRRFVHSLRMGEPTPAMTDLKNTSAPPKPSRTAFDTATGFGLAGSPGCDSLPSSIGDA